MKDEGTINKDALAKTVTTLPSGETALALNVIKAAVSDYARLRKTIKTSVRELTKLIAFFKGGAFELYCGLIDVNIDVDALRATLFKAHGGEDKFCQVEKWGELFAKALADADKGEVENEEE